MVTWIQMLVLGRCLLGGWSDEYTLNTFKHSEWVLVSVDVLGQWVAVNQVLYVTII